MIAAMTATMTASITAATKAAIRGCSHMTYATEGGGVSQLLTFADKGGEGGQPIADFV